MATVNNLVLEYYNKTHENLKNLNDAQTVLSDIDLQFRELKRQLSVHEGNNNQIDANIVRGQIANKQAQYDIQKIKVAQLQDIYDESERVYQQKRQELLTVEEQKSLQDSIALQNKNAAAEIEAKRVAAEKAAIENQTQSFAAKNKQMLIVGGIVLLFVVVGFVVYIKFKNKVK